MAPNAPRVALFRAQDDAEASAAALAARGFEAVLAPVTEIVALSAPSPPGPFDFALATSAKAFASFNAQALAGLPLLVVGEKTAEAARRAGLAPLPPGDDVAALLPRLPPGRALYLAGRDRKPDLEAALQGRVAVWETYAAQARTGWDAREARALEAAQAALHYSARSATLARDFAAAAGVAPAFARLAHVCLSADVAAPLAQTASRLLWPRRPNEDALLDALETALAERR